MFHGKIQWFRRSGIALVINKPTFEEPAPGFNGRNQHLQAIASGVFPAALIQEQGWPDMQALRLAPPHDAASRRVDPQVYAAADAVGPIAPELEDGMEDEDPMAGVDLSLGTGAVPDNAEGDMQHYNTGDDNLENEMDPDEDIYA